MSKDTITIKPEVALAEAEVAYAALKNRNLVLAQKVHEQALRIAELEAAQPGKGSKT